MADRLVVIHIQPNKTKLLDLMVDLKVDNCEKTSFKNNQFDLVYGHGILHHLEFSKCLDEILRILKPYNFLFWFSWPCNIVRI